MFTGNVPSKTFNSYNYVDNINDAGKVTDAIKALKPTSSPKFYAYQEQTFAVRYDTMNDQQKAAEKENSSVKFVRSDHFFMLMNEANGKPINNALQAKTFASGSDDGFDCGKAVDGSFGRTHGWQSSAAGEKWLAVDLGKRLKISRYILKNAETASYPANTNTKAYTLQGSNDKRTWEDIDSVADNTSAIIYKDVACDKNYRFVRVNVTDPGADGVARIQDIELYAVNKSTPDDTELRAEINTSSAITQQGNYTFSSWKAFTDAKKAAEEFSSAAGATQVQIDDLTFALRDAREALSELKSDNLLSALSDAEKVEPQPELKPIYSKASWEAYQTALAKALEIKERLSEVPVTLEQKEVNAVQLALKSAIEGLSADNSELVKVLSEVPSEDKQDNFTAASWKAYQAALAKANDVIAAADKQYMFDEALSELKNALGDMVDIVNLKKAIAAAEAVNLPDYTAASRLTLSDALKTAKTALESDSLSQQDADSAAQTLNLAVESLLLSVKSVTVVSSTALTLKVGMTSGVNAVVSPAEAADKSLVFVSSNAKIASVDQTGKIKAISPGSAVVTVRSSESSVSAAVKVTVNPKAPAKPKIKKSGKKVTVKIKKVKGTTGTEVSVYKGRKRVKRLKTAKSTCKFKLKKGRYTFKLKSYKKTGGKLYYSAFSKAAKFKVK